MSHCDLLITSRWVLPVAPENTVIEQGAVAIADGRIAGVGSAAELAARFEPTEQIDLPHHAVMPGLVNCHGHAAMTLLRGVAEDLPLQTWLSDHIWPLEGQHMDRQFVEDGTRLACAEMLATGTTLFSDMYFFPEVIARVVDELGMRAQVAFPIVQFANAWSQSSEDAFHEGLALSDQWRASEQVHIAFGPHSAYTATRSDLEKTLMYADELDAQVHIHLHENRQEVDEAEQRVGRSWIAELAEIGLLGPSLQAVHMTTLSPEEIELVAERGVRVVHCPHSNFKLASGLCPTDALIRRGVPVSLGTDGAASNNSLDLFAEARLATLLLKYQARDATAGDAPSMLRRMTLTGAENLGLAQLTGSLEAGKAADIAALDLSIPGMAPVFDPMAAVVHGPAGEAVTDVWVGGERLYANGAHTQLDLEAATARAEEWRERMS